eukprot:TRINITY_DN3581_c0_g2_i5.p2 TRINITY_DN3581_c0_g2~~TRINITY_DN3581_c0_g2_i5.p2  ORF type:complete len:126 (+),score=26.36 TRINITY_DN3581_c0_g2_i5:165-542(+)
MCIRDRYQRRVRGVAMSQMHPALRMGKFVGLLAVGLTCVVKSLRTIAPLTWDVWTIRQKAVFRCLVPGLVSMLSAGKWFGSEGPATPTPYFAFMISWAVLCLQRGYAQGLVVRAATPLAVTSCNY